ncbi:MAG: CDP-alcohol phosphatidyltransferase family protein [Pseudomonadota bacterium]
MGVSADAVSFAGLFGALFAAGLVASGATVAGGALFLVASCTDFVDGALARASRRESKYGAFLDSTLDRVAEGAMLAAIALAYGMADAHVLSLVAMLALIGGQLISYMRARAEGLGVTASAAVGFITRVERVALIAAGLLLGVLDYAVWVLMTLSWLGVGQRFMAIRAALR